MPFSVSEWQSDVPPNGKKRKLAITAQFRLTEAMRSSEETEENFMIPNQDADTFDSMEGRLLVAAPRMEDAQFARTVILMLQHTPAGATGIILNRPIDSSDPLPESLKELGEKLKRSKGGSPRMRIGGPLAGPLIGLCPPSVRHGEGGVYFIENEMALDQMERESKASCHFFVGHAAWGEGQLEQELSTGCWLKATVDAEFLSLDCQQMWIAALRESGRTIYREVLGIRGFPTDVSAN